jgi:hypothetical protein
MPETGKFKRSWLLMTASFTMLSQHRKLLLFPLVTAVFITVTALFFTAPVILTPTGNPILSADHWISVVQRSFEPGTPGVNDPDGLHIKVNRGVPVPRTWFVGYLTLAYLVLMFLATFSNVAFANEIFNALSGRPVSVRSGLLFAWSRAGSIFVWSLFAGIVGLIIKSMEQRFGWIGKIVLRLVGVMWSVASVFVIPIIVREPELNPITLLRKSAGTLRKTWGEALIGYAGFSAAMAVFVLATLAAAVLIASSSLAAGVAWIAVTAAAVWILAIIALGYACSVADQIYRCALYIYASEGVVPGPYSAEMMDMAWKIK